MRPEGITRVPGIKVGHATDAVALTGCTVVLCEQGAVVGVDVRGGAPGTRETDLCRPSNLVERCHAVLLSGGSAYGLDAAGGVMRYLEERGRGFAAGSAVVPIVPAAVLFDLSLGDGRVRPDAAMGYAACLDALDGPVAEGNVGAGTGASVGKLFGLAHAYKAGIGSAVVYAPGGVAVGALVAVNAVGDVWDHHGCIIAGARDPASGRFVDSTRALLRGWRPGVPGGGPLGAAAAGPAAGQNTTIGVVAVAATLSKEQANKVAQMAHDGLARAIAPVHTPYDGDTIFALGCGGPVVDVTLVGVAAALAMERAVVRAALAAAPAGGLPGQGSVPVHG